MKFRQLTSWVQGLYTLFTAVWPIVDIRSFMMATGPKTDMWLVVTVGVLLIPISICILLGIFTKHYFPIAVLALTTAAGFAYVDFYYSLNGTISKIYMADGFVEAAFAVCWIIILIKDRKGLRV